MRQLIMSCLIWIYAVYIQSFNFTYTNFFPSDSLLKKKKKKRKADDNCVFMKNWRKLSHNYHQGNSNEYQQNMLL